MLFLKVYGSPALTQTGKLAFAKGNMMRKSAYLLAILLAAASTAAVAKDLKQEKKATASTVAATEMTDAEMDKVTAGGSIEIGPNANVPYHTNNGPVNLYINNTGPNPGGTIGTPVGYHCLAGPCSP
jgi:ABC-type Fe3+ transport system substrate-binding protein